MQRATDASECQGQKGASAGQLRGATASDRARPAVLAERTCLSSISARPLEAPGARQDEVRPSPAAIFERHEISSSVTFAPLWPLGNGRVVVRSHVVVFYFKCHIRNGSPMCSTASQGLAWARFPLAYLIVCT